MAREWYNRPVNNGYTYIDGVTTGNYNNGNPDTYVKTWLEYKKLDHTSADISANQSRVDVKVYSQVIDGGSASGMSIWTSAENFGYAGWDNANRSSYSCTFDFNDKKLNKFFDGVLTIPHLADGTKTITLQAGFSTNGRTSAITGGSASGSVTLDTIETFKPTTISSVVGCNYGFPTTIELSRKASNLRELVTLTNGSKTFTLKTTSSDATVFQYTLPYKDGNDVLVPNTTKPSPSYWTLIVTTYNGSTQIGSAVTQSLTFNLREDDTTLAPTLTAEPTVQAYNDVVSALSTDTAVAGYSKVNVIAQKASVSLKMGATISTRVVIFANGSSASADQDNHISTIVYQSGNFGWTYTVTDSRGYTVQRSNTYPVLAYTAPTLKDITVYRGNSSGTQTEDGSYIYAQATVSVSSVTHNRLVSFTGRVGYSGTEVSMTSGTRATLMTNASASNTYTIYLSATDIFTNTTISRTIQAEDIPFNIKQGGHGVGIGTKNTVYSDEAVFGYLVRAQKGFKNLKVNNRLYGTGNMLDRKRVIQGGYSDSQDISINPYMICTPIMEVKPNTSYNIFVNSLSSYRVVFYAIKCWQRNGSFIENLYTGNVYDYNFTTQSNCYYISINMRHMDNGAIVPSDALELSMSEGNTVGRMEEYVVSGEEVTNILRNMDLYNYSVRDRLFASYNMLDENRIVQGGLDGSKGYPVPSNQTAIHCDQYIKVSPNTVYTCSWGYTNLQPAIFFYNSQKAFISYSQPVHADVSKVSFTTPNNCTYVKMSWDRVGSPETHPSAIDYCQLELGTNYTFITGEKAPFTMSGEEVAEALRCHTDSKVTVRDRVVTTCNLLDKASIVQGSTNGLNYANADNRRVTSAKCKVEPNTTYYIQSTTGAYIETITFLNSSGTVLSYKNDLYSNAGSFTTPSNCVWARFQWLNSNGTLSPSDITAVQLEKGSGGSYIVPFTFDGEDIADRLRSWDYYHSTSVARTTSLSDSGTQLKLPRGWYLIMAQAVANSSGINALALMNNYNGTNYELMDYRSSVALSGYSMGRLDVYWCGYLDFDSTTVKVFAQYNGTGTNQVMLRAKRISL